jgi:hypothetical protein
MTNTNNIIDVTPHNIVPPAVTQLVERYNTFLAKTIENILELGKVVYEVDQNLSGADRAIFCAQTSLEETGSTYRKLKQIGLNYEKLLPHKAYLPNSWTTVYQLTRLKQDEFDTLINTNSLNPYATMKEISAQLATKEDKKPPESVMTFQIILDQKDKNKLFQTEQEIRTMISRLGIRYTYDKKKYEALKEMLSDFKQVA